MVGGRVGRARQGLLAAAAVLMVAGSAACGGDDLDTVGDKSCELGMRSLAAGLEEFSRTKAVGRFLDGISQPASVPCRNAIANLAQGRAVTFDLLREDGEVVRFDVRPQVLQPRNGLPGGSVGAERLQRCAATFGNTFLYTPCVAGDVDPL